MSNYREYEKTLFVAEEESVDSRGFLSKIEKKIPMKVLKNMITRLFSLEFDKISEHDNVIKNLKDEVQQLKRCNETLTDDIKKLRDTNEKLESKLKELFQDSNREKARLYNAYIVGVSEFCKLNEKIKDSVRFFDESKKLHVLEKIAYYLYSPTDVIKQEIHQKMDSSEESQLSSKLLKEIDEFGEKDRTNIEKYLQTLNKRLEDCLIFPEGHTFQREEMESFSRSIPDGKDVFIIGLGFDFPDSKMPPQKPIVFQKD